VDENLWGRTVECGPLEDPWSAPPKDAFELTADPGSAPDQAEEVVVGFERGLPVSLDGRRLDPAALIGEVTRAAGRHGFGRVDENLWGRTVECGPLEDPWSAPPKDAFELTADPGSAPDQAEEVVVGFERGLPVSLDGRRLDPAALIGEVTRAAGRHGFGRVD